jgi:mRNA-degrading endonuclease RelE of RelBE toxin-antitoxin system
MIAQELYRTIRMVESVEKELETVPFEKQEAIKDKLRKLKAERDRMRAVLDGKKEHKIGD